MWQTVDYKGNTVKWYEAELIEKIIRECQEAIDTYDKEQFYEDDCDKFLGESFMAQRILDLIQENER